MHSQPTLMPAAEAVRLLDAITAQGADPVVGGGWGVDALVGEQTREHSDLDLWLTAEHFEPFVVAASTLGVDRVTPWPGDRPWNFVVTDGGSLRIDLHLVEALSSGDLHYGSVSGGHRFPAQALGGTGTIAGLPVRCEVVEWSLRFHQGYPPRPVDVHDLELLAMLAHRTLP